MLFSINKSLLCSFADMNEGGGNKQLLQTSTQQHCIKNVLIKAS